MCIICQFNQSKAEGFADHLLEILNHSSTSLMISIGHRSGLFDTLGDMKAANSTEIARKAGLQERYVREWLNAMVVARIIEIDEEADLYWLPIEHAAVLTRKNPADNMAVFAQYIPVLAQVEDAVLDCFKNGGGVPYEAYDRFHEVMAEDSGQTVLSSLVDQILPLATGLIKKLEQGIRVLDIGCGSGKALNLLAETFPNSTFTGYDLCEAPLSVAIRDAMKKGLTNVIFQKRDLAQTQATQDFDLITAFDVIHDQARPDLVLKFVHDSLKKEGTFLMQDIDASEDVRKNIDHPLGSLLYSFSTMHCMTVSLAQGGMGLGTMWGTEKAQQMLKEAGFERIIENRLEHDPQNCYFVVKR